MKGRVRAILAGGLTLVIGTWQLIVSQGQQVEPNAKRFRIRGDLEF